MQANHKHTDPTYLRTIYDGLLLGTLHKENASALPMGLVGMYEEALPPAKNVNERKKFLEFFAVWALLKKEVSVAFLMTLLEGWSEERIIYYISKYSKWFNSPQSGKYVLYHERLRAFILQKISKNHFNNCNEKIINNSQEAFSRRSSDEWENYALEYLSNHMLIPALEKGDGSVLKLLAYNTTYWNRQVEISKGFEWSKRMLNDMMLWASKYDDDEVIECSLNKVDLHNLEQNDAPRIVELVAHNDIETALQRIEDFGGNDKEGLQRKFILYMLCLMELTFLDSKDKPFRKYAIEKLLKHLDENLPVDHSVLNWNDFFPSYLMFQMAFIWEMYDLNYQVIYNLTDKLNIDWLDKNYVSNESQINTLLKGYQSLSEEKEKFQLISDLSVFNAKLGFYNRSLELVQLINDLAIRNITYSKISIERLKNDSFNQSLDALNYVNDEIICFKTLTQLFILTSDDFEKNNLIFKIERVLDNLEISSYNSYYPTDLSEVLNSFLMVVTKYFLEKNETLKIFEYLNYFDGGSEEILCNVSIDFAKKGHISHAIDFFRRGYDVIKTPHEKSIVYNVKSLIIVIEHLVQKCGKILVEKFVIDLKVLLLNAIADNYCERKDYSEAQKVLAIALESSIKLVNFDSKIYLLERIVLGLSISGRFIESINLLNELTEIYRERTNFSDWIPSDLSYNAECKKIDLLINCAHDSFLAGSNDFTNKFLDLALESIKELSDIRMIHEMQMKVSLELISQGEITRASQLIDLQRDEDLMLFSIRLIKNAFYQEALSYLRLIKSLNNLLKSLIDISIILLQNEEREFYSTIRKWLFDILEKSEVFLSNYETYLFLLVDSRMFDDALLILKSISNQSVRDKLAAKSIDLILKQRNLDWAYYFFELISNDALSLKSIVKISKFYAEDLTSNNLNFLKKIKNKKNIFGVFFKNFSIQFLKNDDLINLKSLTIDFIQVENKKIDKNDYQALLIEIEPDTLKVNRFEDYIRFAFTILDDVKRINILIKLSSSMISHYCYKEAESLLDECYSQSNSISDKIAKGGFYISIFVNLVRLNKIEKALALTSFFIENANSIRSGQKQFDLFWEFSKSLFKVGSGLASNVLKMAYDSLASISNLQVQINSFIEMSGEFYNQGDNDMADFSISKAQNIVGEIQSEWLKIQYYIKLSKELFKQKKYEKAENQLLDSANLLEKIVSNRELVNAYVDLANEFYNQGYGTSAEFHLEKAKMVAYATAELRDRIQFLIILSRQFYNQERLDLALSTLMECADLVMNIEISTQRDQILCEISNVLALFEDFELLEMIGEKIFSWRIKKDCWTLVARVIYARHELNVAILKQEFIRSETNKRVYVSCLVEEVGFQDLKIHNVVKVIKLKYLDVNSIGNFLKRFAAHESLIQGHVRGSLQNLNDKFTLKVI